MWGTVLDGSSSVTLSSNLNSLHLHEVAGGVVDAVVVGLHRHPPKIVRYGNTIMKTNSKPIKGEGCVIDMFLFSCLRSNKKSCKTKGPWRYERYAKGHMNRHIRTFMRKFLFGFLKEGKELGMHQGFNFIRQVKQNLPLSPMDYSGYLATPTPAPRSTIQKLQCVDPLRRVAKPHWQTSSNIDDRSRISLSSKNPEKGNGEKNQLSFEKRPLTHVRRVELTRQRRPPPPPPCKS